MGKSGSKDTEVSIPIGPDQIAVIVYSLVAEVESPKRTANAPVLTVVQNSMLLRDIDIVG